MTNQEMLELMAQITSGLEVLTQATIRLMTAVRQDRVLTDVEEAEFRANMDAMFRSPAWKPDEQPPTPQG